MITALENKQGPDIRRDLSFNIIDTIAVKQTQSPSLIFPGGVHIKKHRNDLTVRVRVDLAVLEPAFPADREHRRLTLKIDRELGCDSMPESFRVHLIDQFHELAAARDLGERKTSGCLDLRVCFYQFVLPLLTDKI